MNHIEILEKQLFWWNEAYSRHLAVKEHTLNTKKEWEEDKIHCENVIQALSRAIKLLTLYEQAEKELK